MEEQGHAEGEEGEGRTMGRGELLRLSHHALHLFIHRLSRRIGALEEYSGGVRTHPAILSGTDERRHAHPHGAEFAPRGGFFSIRGDAFVSRLARRLSFE